MILFLFLPLFLLLAVIIIFSFPKFSPIPYFPSNKKDIPIILKSLNLKNNQTVIDLGAGDGIVIFKAAHEALRKKLNTKFVAIELNPILILLLLLQRLFHPNKKNIKIIQGDIFTMSYSAIHDTRNAIMFYMYISPWHMSKVIKNLELKTKNLNIVSYFYPLPLIFNLRPKIAKGLNNIYIYSSTHLDSE